MNPHPPTQTPENLHRSLRQNWSTGILRDELELLDALIEGRLPKKIYVINTETQREFNNPKLRSIHHLKHIEENRKGRYAYTPNRVAPRGAVPESSDRAYPEVIPRFVLPKMPY